MNAVVKIEQQALNVVEYKSVPVLTTTQLAEFYGTDQNNIQMNFTRNTERFIEGKHFFKLQGDELKQFKNLPTVSGLVDKRSSHLILWTEKGAARHAKILDTEQAWEVFEQLEDCYFAVKEMAQPKLQKEKPLQLGSITRQCAMMYKALGFKGNQHVLATDKAVKALTGQSPLELIGETHLVAENKMQIFTPTQIGELFEPKLSGKKINELIAQLGYQEKTGSSWCATSKGENLCEVLDTGKKHSNGVPIKQIKWYSSVIDDIKPLL